MNIGILINNPRTDREAENISRFAAVSYIVFKPLMLNGLVSIYYFRISTQKNYKMSVLNTYQQNGFLGKLESIISVFFFG